MGKTDTAKDEPSFEKAIDRLESIVKQLESDDLSLDDLLVRYEEGVKLARVCSQRIDSAEKRIELINRDAAGKPKLTEFEPAPKSAPERKDEISLF